MMVASRRLVAAPCMERLLPVGGAGCAGFVAPAKALVLSQVPTKQGGRGPRPIRSPATKQAKHKPALAQSWRYARGVEGAMPVGGRRAARQEEEPMAKAKVDYKEALKKHLEKIPAYPK